MKRIKSQKSHVISKIIKETKTVSSALSTKAHNLFFSKPFILSNLNSLFGFSTSFFLILYSFFLQIFFTFCIFFFGIFFFKLYSPSFSSSSLIFSNFCFSFFLFVFFSQPIFFCEKQIISIIIPPISRKKR